MATSKINSNKYIMLYRYTMSAYEKLRLCLAYKQITIPSSGVFETDIPINWFVNAFSVNSDYYVVMAGEKNGHACLCMKQLSDDSIVTGTRDVRILYFEA